MGVCNAQTWLERVVHEAVEVLPELSGKFDIGVIDHGSTDDTADVAASLAAIYPQVYYTSAAQAESANALVQAAWLATGEVVVLRPARSSALLRDLDRLWRSLDSHDLVIGRLGQPRGGLTRWTRRLARSIPGASPTASHALELCLLTRTALARLDLSELTVEKLIAAAPRHGLASSEVELSPRACDAHAGARRTGASRTSSAPQRRVHGASNRAGLARPNFLGRVKPRATGD
jgi:glycosyltransferase involved in cell wall biosynthesis